MKGFEWIELHREIAKYILDNFKDNHKGLVQVLKDIGEMENLENESSLEAKKIELEDIDPFMFLEFFMTRFSTKRVARLEKLKELWGLNSIVEDDFQGFPMVYFLSLKTIHKEFEIKSLWELFEEAFNKSIKEITFNKAIKIINSGLTSLSHVLFLIAPDRYFPYDKKTKILIDKKELLKTQNWKSYKFFLKTIKDKYPNTTFYKLYDKACQNYQANKKEVKREHSQFKWTNFYEEFADKLLEFKNNRSGLMTIIHRIATRVNALNILNDQYSDGSIRPLQDICPFTVFGLFNRGITNDNRKSIAQELAIELKVTQPVPDAFDAIPILNNQKSWFFGYQKDRDINDIDALWNCFAASLDFASSEDDSMRDFFLEQYDIAVNLKHVKWNLTMGLYWIRPWSFPTLESKSREYIVKELGLHVETNGLNKRCTGEDYLHIKEILENKFLEANFSVHSFPDLSFAAVNYTSEETPQLVSLQPLNTILYGPPGTGKTYNTINHAVAICEGEEIKTVVDRSRDIVQTKFKALQEDGQIVFSTFHQSMSYEDFVEGIKPDSTGDIGISYPVQPGIFVDLCNKARKNWENSILDKSASFENVWDAFIQPLISDEVDNIEVSTARGKYQIYEITDSGTIRFEKQNGSKRHSLNAKTLKRLYLDSEALKKMGGLAMYYSKLIETLKNIKVDTKPKEPLKPFVLIVDEINRGNVSAILGELITLIEDDKRLGEENELRVTLPYSKDDDFGVPPNLYIVGTMNTADRSVEALDTALRRRFTFEEMMPNPELLKEIKIGGIDLSTMLTSINDRLELLVGRDHTIGHAFFMKLNSLEQLVTIFHNKVMPQLQEYFYGDWSKINLILGDSFVKLKNQNQNNIWPESVSANKDDFEVREIWKVTNPNNWTAEAFKSIYAKVAERENK